VFVALGIQHPVRMCYIVNFGLPRCTGVSHITSKTTRFSGGKKVTEHKMCVLMPSTSCVRKISHSKKKWARYAEKSFIGLYVTYPLLVSDFNETWIFWTVKKKHIQISHFMKIRSVRAGLFHADRQTDGRTDLTKLIVDFCNFAKAPEHPTWRPHSVLTCFVWISDVELSYWVLVFVTETASVYCAVRTESLTMVQVAFCLVQALP